MEPALASIISDFWNDQLVEHGRQWVFLVLLGFVGSFAFIRMSTRLMRSPRVPWWPGSIETGGVHVHHLVFGIVLMMAAGAISFGGFATDVIYGICALFFGIGAGLTIDEFALWVHLDDVYWAEEGRQSIDATVLAVGALSLILLGVRPFEVDTGDAGQVILSLVLLLFHFACVAICFLKGRMAHGFFGLFIPLLDVYGAARLGKPDSAWARRFYGERNPKKQARAEKRFHAGRRTDRFKESLRTAIGGATETDYLAKIGRDE
jgi:lysyl-tRNA synthetase class 2